MSGPVLGAGDRGSLLSSFQCSGEMETNPEGGRDGRVKWDQRKRTLCCGEMEGAERG